MLLTKHLELTEGIRGTNVLKCGLPIKVKQSRYTPWRRLGEEEV
jgi:hypothetical protein